MYVVVWLSECPCLSLSLVTPLLSLGRSAVSHVLHSPGSRCEAGMGVTKVNEMPSLHEGRFRTVHPSGVTRAPAGRQPTGSPWPTVPFPLPNSWNFSCLLGIFFHNMSSPGMRMRHFPAGAGPWSLIPPLYLAEGAAVMHTLNWFSKSLILSGRVGLL